MEKNLKIKTKDGHLIYGTLNYSKPSKNLIIFVHGLTGHKSEHQFYNASKFFTQKNFNTFRFGLYSDESKARSLLDCLIKNHSEDINLVVKYFSNKYAKIFLVGHSLGGPSIILSDQMVNSIVLWDPSIGLDKLFKEEATFEKAIGRYILDWGIQILISKKMVNEGSNIKDSELIEKISKPIKIIFAGKGVLHKRWKGMINKIKTKNEFVIIKNAGHCFNEEGAEEILFKETLEWFKK